MTRHVVLVCGPPCAGKNHYVDQHIQPGDLLVDHDVYARQAGSPRRYAHPPEYREAAEVTFAEALTYIAASSDVRAWVIRCAPDPAHRKALADFIRADEVVVIDPGVDTCLERARYLRSRRTTGVIHRWYAANPSPGGRGPHGSNRT